MLTLSLRICFGGEAGPGGPFPVEPYDESPQEEEGPGGSRLCKKSLGEQQGRDDSVASRLQLLQGPSGASDPHD